MAGITDGMGGEEINQTGPTSSQINVAGSIHSASQISGANIYSAGAVTGSEVSNADGKLSIVNGGVVACAAGSTGTVEFATNFKNTTWAIGFATSGTDTSATVPTISGTLNVSGALVIGEASKSYYYVAVGY